MRTMAVRDGKFVRDNDGNIAIFSGDQAIAAVCENAAKSLLDECIYNINLGLPYFSVIWNGTPNTELFTRLMRDELLEVPGVRSVSAIEVSHIRDILNYTATIITENSIPIGIGGAIKQFQDL